MDDLTSLKGIGKATSKKLKEAGIDSFAKLAAATPDQLNAALVSGGPDDWAAMIAEAGKVAPAAETRELTADEVNDLVAAWDKARAELNAAGEAVAAVQIKIDALAPDADRSALDAELAAAHATVATAHTTIDALRPLPEGVRLPDATRTIPTDSQDGGLGQPGSPAPDLTSQGSDGDTDNDAAPEPDTVASVSDLFGLDAQHNAELARLAVEHGIAPSEVLDAARRMLAGRDVLTNDLDDDDDLDAIYDAAFSSSTFELSDGRIAITVIGPVKGRRRGGFDFGAVPQTVLVTEDQLAVIQGDAGLSVTLGGLPPGVDMAGRRLTVDDFDFDGEPTLPVTVLGPVKTRRRAGFEFGPTAQTVDVTYDELISILSDESLAVTAA